MKIFGKLFNRKRPTRFKDLSDEIIFEIMVQLLLLAKETNDTRLSGYFDLYRFSKVNKRVNRIAYLPALDPNYNPQLEGRYGLRKALQIAKFSYFNNSLSAIQDGFIKELCFADVKKLKVLLTYDVYNTINMAPFLHLAIQNYETAINQVNKSARKQDKNRAKKQLKKHLEVIKLLIKNGAEIEYPLSLQKKYATTYDLSSYEGKSGLDIAKHIQTFYVNNQLMRLMARYSQKFDKKTNLLKH